MLVSKSSYRLLGRLQHYTLVRALDRSHTKVAQTADNLVEVGVYENTLISGFQYAVFTGINLC